MLRIPNKQVFIDGVACLGKSTFIAQFDELGAKSEFSMAVEKYPFLMNKDVDIRAANVFALFTQQTIKGKLVCDRGFPSLLLYGSIFQGRQFEDEALKAAKELFTEPIFLVMCTEDQVDDVVEQMMKRGSKMDVAHSSYVQLQMMAFWYLTDMKNVWTFVYDGKIHTAEYYKAMLESWNTFVGWVNGGMKANIKPTPPHYNRLMADYPRIARMFAEQLKLSYRPDARKPEATTTLMTGYGGRKYRDDAGFDLTCAEELVLKPHESGFMRLTERVSVAKGMVGKLHLRSSWSRKLLANVGVVDCGYVGPLSYQVYNHTNETVTIHMGARVAQLVYHPISLDVAVVKDLGETDRGAAGFGSSGV